MPARQLRGLLIGDAAKQLQISRTALFKLLRSRGYLSSNNIARQQYVREGWFVIETRGYKCGPVDKQYAVTLVTGAGLAHLQALIEEESAA